MVLFLWLGVGTGPCLSLTDLWLSLTLLSLLLRVFMRGLPVYVAGTFLGVGLFLFVVMATRFFRLRGTHPVNKNMKLLNLLTCEQKRNTSVQNKTLFYVSYFKQVNESTAAAFNMELPHWDWFWLFLTEPSAQLTLSNNI